MTFNNKRSQVWREIFQFNIGKRNACGNVEVGATEPVGEETYTIECSCKNANLDFACALVVLIIFSFHGKALLLPWYYTTEANLTSYLGQNYGNKE